MAFRISKLLEATVLVFTHHLPAILRSYDKPFVRALIHLCLADGGVILADKSQTGDEFSHKSGCCSSLPVCGKTHKSNAGD